MKTKNILFIFLCFVILFSQKAAADSVLNHKISAKLAAEKLPEFSDTACRFTQEKSVKNSSAGEVVLKSGGNFKFEKAKGVTFETTYPLKSTTSYTTEQNRHVSSIVKALANKNYTYLEKNFDIYYLAGSNKSWELALKPKNDSKASAALKLISIKGKKIIDNMVIDTTNSKTIINYTDCR